MVKENGSKKSLYYHPLYTNNETEVWDLQNQKRFQLSFQVHFIRNIGQNNTSRQCHALFV